MRLGLRVNAKSQAALQVHQIKNFRFIKKPEADIAVIVGSGTSMKGFEYSDLHDSRFSNFCINREAWNNLDKYTPDFWVYGDNKVGKDYRKTEIHPNVKVLCWIGYVGDAISCNPNWNDKVYSYEIQKGDYWDASCGRLYSGSTTATLALCAAIRMGFKKVILLGIDCYSTDADYYHDGSDKHDRKVVKRYGEMHQTDQHVLMDKHLGIVAKAIKEIGVEVIQCSLKSPVSHWQKMSWQQAVRKLDE